MKKSLFYSAAATITMLISCHSQKPLTKEPTANNSTYEVEYLFEHDGCKVYRFKDRGNVVYFTSCNGQTTKITTDSIHNKATNSINRKQ